MYRIYTEVKPLPEHSNSNIFRRYAIYINKCAFLYLFSSILLLCFIYVYLLLHCCYYFITTFMSRVLTEVYITSQHSSINNNVTFSIIYLSMLYFTVFPPFFFCLLYDLIFFPIIDSIFNYY